MDSGPQRVALHHSERFDIDKFPGYVNRRGAGRVGGRKFPMGDAVMDSFVPAR